MSEPRRHAHPDPLWPVSGAEWESLGHCRECGLTMLRLYIRSATWVIRRVEKVAFLDDRTVRRQVSVDYVTPSDAVALHRPGTCPLRVIPLTMMRRKSLVNFDLRDSEDRRLPLLGLREAQALTLSVTRAWAARSLLAAGYPAADALQADKLLRHLVAGDQREMNKAFDRLNAYRDPAAAAAAPHPHGILAGDEWFTGLLDRLAANFILFTTDDAEPGSRRIVKFSYDEPLTLRYSRSSYRPYSGHRAPSYAGRARRLWRFEPWPLAAGLGLAPTLVRFPVPSAELAASFHFEIFAPPAVSIVEASLLAGLPNLYHASTDPREDRRTWRAGPVPCAIDVDDDRLIRRPSFDSVSGGYPTVDLHVADVPYGSLSRAQVKLQPSTAGWLSGAAVGLALATVTLFAAYKAAPLAVKEPDVSAIVLITFAAALVAVLVREDPHKMLTRLLSLARGLAALTVMFLLAGAVVIAFFPRHAAPWLNELTRASLLPTALVVAAWALARRQASREARRPRDRVSPWEQYRDERRRPPWYVRVRRRQSHVRVRRHPWHVRAAADMQRDDHPYDLAVRRLHFDRAAIKVASSEGGRGEFPWTREFRERFWKRLMPAAMLRCQVVRRLDGSHPPGWVEAELTDAAGERWTFRDRASVFIDAGDALPAPGLIACRVLPDPQPSGVLTVTTERPWCLTSVEGRHEFTVPADEVLTDA